MSIFTKIFQVLRLNRGIKTADLGEKTKPQFGKGGSGVMGMFSSGSELEVPAEKTFEEYRKMRNQPTAALARAVAVAPIRTASITTEGADESTPPDRIEFIDRQFKKLWPKLVADMVRGIEFGYQPFERVFKAEETLLGYSRIKPLLPDTTEILIDENTGRFTGFENQDVEIFGPKAFIYTHDQEGDNFYGRSRNENIREFAWTPWVLLNKRLEQFASKVAGITALIEYPEGESEDATGTLVSNFELAKAVLKNLGKGHGVAFPNVFSRFAGDLAQAGVNVEGLQAWKISFLEASGNHIAEFIEGLRYYDSLTLRGWLVPERATIEGQFGTKAEAGTHGDLALVIAGLTLTDMLESVNTQLVDTLLLFNWGPEAVGTVRLTTEGLDPLTRVFFRGLVEKVLSDPDNVFLLESKVDFDMIIEQVGLPLNKDADGDAIDVPVKKTNQVTDLLDNIQKGIKDGEPSTTTEGGS